MRVKQVVDSLAHVCSTIVLSRFLSCRFRLHQLHASYILDHCMAGQTHHRRRSAVDGASSGGWIRRVDDARNISVDKLQPTCRNFVFNENQKREKRDLQSLRIK